MSLSFLWEFVKRPGTIGAVAPSSAALARQMVAEIDMDAADVIVEYGPGTGSFTTAILAHMKPEAKLFAIEYNPKMAAVFHERFPDVMLFEDSVASVAELLARQNLTHADCIISGLPWAAFDSDLQDRLMTATLSILSPGGRFTTFAYLQGTLLPAGKRFRRKLYDCFTRVRTSPVVWWNLPPAFVYRCEK